MRGRVFVLLSGPCRWHLQYSHRSSSSSNSDAAAGVQIESLATLPEEMDTHTHTQSMMYRQKSLFGHWWKKKISFGRGVDESKKKNNISILCCWPGRPCSGEIYTRGTTKQTSAPVCIYTTTNGWVRVDSEGAKTRTMPRTLFRLSLYDERFLARVPRVPPALSRHSRGRKRRKVSMTGAWVRSRAAAAHCSLYLF
jgi:hypothetical protein